MTIKNPTTSVRLPAPGTPYERHRAARTVASLATDADECATVLDMLGLPATVGLTAPPEEQP